MCSAAQILHTNGARAISYLDKILGAHLDNAQNALFFFACNFLIFSSQQLTKTGSLDPSSNLREKWYHHRRCRYRVVPPPNSIRTHSRDTMGCPGVEKPMVPWWYHCLRPPSSSRDSIGNCRGTVVCIGSHFGHLDFASKSHR